MSQKTIIVDDLTDADIPEGGGWSAVINLVLTGPDIGAEPVEYQVNWDLTPDTAESLRYLIGFGDLGTFLTRMRPTQRTVAADTEIIRQWARDHHPELDVPARGRLGSWLVTLYRREMAEKEKAANEKAEAEAKNGETAPETAEAPPEPAKTVPKSRGKS